VTPVAAHRHQLQGAIDAINRVVRMARLPLGTTFSDPDGAPPRQDGDPGEFTDAEAGIVLALVAVQRASGLAHVNMDRGQLDQVRVAAQLVRMGRGADTPGWDVGDLDYMVGAVLDPRAQR
jgi:hypothetical protein